MLPLLLVNVPPAPPSLQVAEVAPPPNEPPKAAVVPPWQIADTAAPAFTVGFGFTVNNLLAEVVPQPPPAVVSVRVTGDVDDAEAVYVAVAGVLPPLLVKVPPAAPSLHIAEVAPPPNEPPKDAVVPPWHIAATAEPTFTVGLGLTVKLLLAEVVPHAPPEVVKVKVTGEVEDADAVYVVVAGVLPVLLVNVPPAPPSLHTAEVAPPPNEPPNAAVVPPWQIPATAEPAFAVGFGFTVNDLFADVVLHDPPDEVSVKVTGLVDDADAVYVVVPGVLPLLLANTPPAPPSLHTAPVAPPPNEPPNAKVVPPWQIAATAEPAFTVGLGLTTNELVAEVEPHEPPEVVNVKVTGLVDEADAVYVVVPGVLPVLFVNEPPAPPSLHIADVAPPPNEPPKAAVVPP